VWAALLHCVLCLFTPEPSRKLHILGHDRDPFRVYGAQICVLEQAHEVGLRGLLERDHRLGLEPQIAAMVLGNLTYKALEGQSPNEQLRGFLKLPDLP